MLTTNQIFRYFSLTLIRAFSSILDVAGVALIGLVGAIAASSASKLPLTIRPIAGTDLNPYLTLEYLPQILIVTLALFLVKGIIAVFVTRRLTKLLATAESSVSERIFQGLLHFEIQASRQWSVSEINFGITTSLYAAIGRLLTYVSVIVSEGFLLLGIIVIMLLVSPAMMLFVIAYFGIVAFAIHFLVNTRYRTLGHTFVDSNVSTTRIITESLGAFREIYTLGRQSFFIERLTDARNKMAQSAGSILFLQSLPRYIVEIALMFGAVGLIAFQVVNSNPVEAAGILGIFLTAGMRIVASLLPLQGAIGALSEVVGEAKLSQELDQYFGSLDSTEQISVELNSPPLSNLIVEVDKLSFKYQGEEEFSLKELNLSISTGEFIAFIGPSGAGKSTLADVILGILAPTNGSVNVAGTSPRLLDLKATGMIGYVPQKPGLIEGSIAENIALGIPADEIDEDAVTKVLKYSALWDFVSGLENGIHETLGKQANSLSGGQTQRLGIARALYSNPKILVLDEATSALDAESEAQIGEVFEALRGEMTLIVIAHRLSTIKEADRIYVLDKGKIVATGTFPELQKSSPLVSRYSELMGILDHDNEG